MTTGPTRPVAVGVDGTDACTAAITWGARLAAAESRPLLLVHGGARLLQDVSGDPGAARANAVLASRHAAHHAVTEAAARAVAAVEPGVRVRTRVVADDVVPALVEATDRAEVLVIGTRRTGVRQAAPLGHVTRSLLRAARCPVVVARPAAGRPQVGVVVGVDGTERSAPALTFAARMAARWSEPLLVVHCYWPPSMTGRDPTQFGTELDQRIVLAEQLAGLAADQPDLTLRTRLVTDFADRTLLQEAASRRLLVLGHDAATTWRDAFWGSVAPTVLRQSAGDVAVVPVHCGPT
jgi:nucleotide-binding universal stress UspA family protein